MKKLLKIYGFDSKLQYYEMILESVVNGQISQSRDQFNSMPKVNKFEFICHMNLTERQKNAFIMYL